MNLASAKWYPIAAILTTINVISIPFTGGMHAVTHVVLAVVCGVWAARLRLTPRPAAAQDQIGGQEAIEALEGDLDQMRQQLSETQERLDFAERLLAKRPDPRSVGTQQEPPH